ncbi:hypothetical protein M3175_10155 [Robertmurraya korlensis]|uniref:hypothetical protein n=1 Tax=Robertmurraya korlensis TaxID=519977 RepID=UPI002041711B|nr:hypothetical protein [Robertmurraya korlensis]MCM3601094.1 hypothetical protein [Robertmurraya korlensis]
MNIREYIGKNHEHSSFDFNVHQVEYYFICNLINGLNNNGSPTNPDSHQVGIEWVQINDLLDYRIYPKELRRYIVRYSRNEKSPVYLGDIN